MSFHPYIRPSDIFMDKRNSLCINMSDFFLHIFLICERLFYNKYYVRQSVRKTTKGIFVNRNENFSDAI